MDEFAKRLQVRFGAIACTIEGYDDPTEKMRSVLGMMQRMISENPALADQAYAMPQARQITSLFDQSLDGRITDDSFVVIDERDQDRKSGAAKSVADVETATIIEEISAETDEDGGTVRVGIAKGAGENSEKSATFNIFAPEVMDDFEAAPEQADETPDLADTAAEEPDAGDAPTAGEPEAVSGTPDVLEPEAVEAERVAEESPQGPEAWDEVETAELADEPSVEISASVDEEEALADSARPDDADVLETSRIANEPIDVDVSALIKERETAELPDLEDERPVLDEADLEDESGAAEPAEPADESADVEAAEFGDEPSDIEPVEIEEKPETVAASALPDLDDLEIDEEAVPANEPIALDAAALDEDLDAIKASGPADEPADVAAPELAADWEGGGASLRAEEFDDSELSDFTDEPDDLPAGFPEEEPDFAPHKRRRQGLFGRMRGSAPEENDTDGMPDIEEAQPSVSDDLYDTLVQELDEIGSGEIGDQASADDGLSGETAAEDSGQRFREFVERAQGDAETTKPGLSEGADATTEQHETTAAELASLSGAESIPDLLAASAAWLTLVQAKDRFTRRDVMEVFGTLPGDHSRTLEAKIKGYGKLVRSGVLLQTGDGVFAMTPNECERFKGYLEEA